MKKIVLSFVLVFSMLLCSAAIVMADSGFRIGIGYEEPNNTISYSIGGTTSEYTYPSKMYTVDLGYDFDDNFAINGKFNWGSRDFRIFPFLGNTNESQLWLVEGVYKAPVSNNFKIGGIIGYVNSQTTIKGLIFPFKQTLEGAYLGALFTLNPTDNFELGVSYRYLINPTGNYNSTSLENLNVSILEGYGKVAVDKNWSVKAGYTYLYADYTLSPFKANDKIGGLWARMEYKF